MVRTPARPVECPNCRRKTLDRGQDKTCESCGFQPLPSYYYPVSCCFHPSYRHEGISEAIPTALQHRS